MSRVFGKRSRTYEETYLVEKKCDLCGTKAENDDNWSEPGTYSVDETELTVVVRQKEGNNYPDGGSGKKYVVDLCPKCFKERLIPWLCSQGAAVGQEEWDW